MNIKYGVPENIAKNLVFIDGLGRSGKSIFFGIISSLERMENIKFFTPLEHIVPALGLEPAFLNFAKSFLRFNMNELAYMRLLSRNENFRYEDWTGVLNCANPKIYFERLSRKDGDNVVDELRQTDRFFPFITHELMVNLESLNMLDLGYRMIELFRHPIDNLYSWWAGGWGKRFSNDPRAFTFAVTYNNELVPWFCAGYEEEWLSLNPMERCLRAGLDVIRRSVKQYQKAGNPDYIHILTFEDFVEHPDEELAKICSFLGTATTDLTQHFIHRERCPRVLDIKERERKLDEFKDSVNAELLDKLVNASKEYETNLYGLKK